MMQAPLFTILPRVDSTNNYAMAKVHAGLASHGMAWMALEQTAGKGQRGRHWESAPGKNIALSLVVDPETLCGQPPFFLSALVALACADFMEQKSGAPIQIKWPNDLYWGDRKAGGILIENLYRGASWKFAIVGIGINLNQEGFGEEIRNPVSLKQISGVDFDVEKTARELHQLLLIRLAAADQTRFADLLEAYNSRLYKRNEFVLLEKEGEILPLRLKNVNSRGQLVTMGEVEQVFDFGEVNWVL